MIILERISEPKKFHSDSGELGVDNYSEEWFYDLSQREQDFILNDDINTRVEVCCEGKLVQRCNLAEWLYTQQFYVGWEDDSFEGKISPNYLNLKNTKYFEEYGLSGHWEFKVIN